MSRICTVEPPLYTDMCACFPRVLWRGLITFKFKCENGHGFVDHVTCQKGYIVCPECYPKECKVLQPEIEGALKGKIKWVIA